VLSVRSADEFYGKMGSYSSELLNGHLVDSNGLIERVVKLGPIADLRQLRDKHLYKGGLQADMGVFRELMQTRLPRLAKHLQRLQGPVENAFEPPLTNVFTMQWFLTMFCTCLPMSCVLRVWDLVLIEGSDVLLRTALVLWSLLEE